MLEYRRYRDAGAHSPSCSPRPSRYLYRSAPLPPELRRVSLEAARPAYEPDRLGAALGDLLRVPPRPTPATSGRRSRSSGGCGVLRELLGRRPTLDFDEAFGAEDRLTQAVTLFALLEMHKKGEATWEQRENFGPIEIVAASGVDRRRPRQ